MPSVMERVRLDREAEERLRDEFAMACDISVYNPLQTLELLKRNQLGAGSSIPVDVTTVELAQYIANLRYIEADAMMARRSQREE